MSSARVRDFPEGWGGTKGDGGSGCIEGYVDMSDGGTLFIRPILRADGGTQV